MYEVIYENCYVAFTHRGHSPAFWNPYRLSEKEELGNL